MQRAKAHVNRELLEIEELIDYACSHQDEFRDAQRESVHAFREHDAACKDELQARGYQLGLYSSNTLYRPVVLDRTAFANVPNLRIVTEPASDPAWKRDRTLTREWYDWLERRDPERPFFGFLFYDTAMSAGPPPDYPVRWPPADDSPQQRNLAKYRSAVHYVYAIVCKVLSDMERRGLLDYDDLIARTNALLANSDAAAWMLYKLDSRIETVFLMAGAEHQAIASKLVKEIARLGGDVSKFVTPAVRDALKARYAR